MRISSLEITKLYGLYDYNVKFNSDLTFIYGKNGCGKTTILDILESIVSGRVYDLFAWPFDKIVLKYYGDSKSNLGHKKYRVSIILEENDIEISFNEEKQKINKEEFLRIHADADSMDELFSVMSKKYTVLIKIKNEFNYVYLPLNRNLPASSDYYYYRRRGYGHRFYYDFDNRTSFNEEEIDKAMELVEKKYAETSAIIRTINDDFRNNVLKSLLSTFQQGISDQELLSFITDAFSKTDLDEIKGKFYRLLNSLDLLNDLDVERYDDFFDRYKNEIENIKKRHKPLSFSFIYSGHEIEKVKTLIKLAEEMEEAKSQALKRINSFVETLNSFISSDDGDKRVHVDETGVVHFSDNNGKAIISPSQLSSGEKQLFVFFANLVFNVNDEESSIFIIDEPELSLHLNWQKMFVEKALKVNPNMQFILATHAPEIVFNRRDKMVKLEKIQHKS